jgi:hypothetical protein
VALFGRKVAKAPVALLPRLELTLIDDTAEFEGHDGPVAVHGFNLDDESGERLCLSDDGPIGDRLYYFRVAGLMHHQAAAQGEHFTPMSQVFLVREPTNVHDPNAIQVLGQGREFIGYVPREAAVSMSALMKRIGTPVVAGMVTNSFSSHGKRNAVEILSAIERDIGLTGTVTVDEGDDDSPPDDAWRLKYGTERESDRG